MTFELGPRFRWDERPSSRATGIYAYFIDRLDELLPISVPAHGLLYIGMTDSGLDVRCHFEHAHSGFSTFRRSLGSILKSQLELRALPRSPGKARTNVLNFRFDPDGEASLTKWMRANLTYSYREVGNNGIAVERDAIRSAGPPLNLIGWKNPQRAEVKRLRAICVMEATHLAQSTRQA
ncbi:GIY-YIG nuclease family protein [Bosea sp. UC22_33]|uniref:GIY-YIG nuclease family protein n=1 Tax=Bosea sp. UC22_33 TaxID=3350165 RepID=UPI00366F7C7E